jgi:Serpentine type 7TM GPCR chemoreceptor Srw
MGAVSWNGDDDVSGANYDDQHRQPNGYDDVEQPTTWVADGTRCNYSADASQVQYHYVGGGQLAAFHDLYQDYHGYLASVVCVFGIVANAANIVVLTRRNMISATNCILTALAVADGLTMAAYLPFALRFYVLYGTTPNPERNSLAAVIFMMFYACFSVVVHTIAIWLTVVLAVFRYVTPDVLHAIEREVLTFETSLSSLRVSEVGFVTAASSTRSPKVWIGTPPLIKK